MVDNTVVPECAMLSEDEFHDTLNVTLSRLIKRHGKGKVAKALGISERQVRNIFNGSAPAPFRLWNLLALDQTAHLALDAEYGLRKVPSDAICSTDPIAAKKAALLAKVIDAESENSPGGSKVILQEILNFDEDYLRDVHGKLALWIDQIENARKSSERTLRAVPNG